MNNARWLVLTFQEAYQMQTAKLQNIQFSATPQTHPELVSSGAFRLPPDPSRLHQAAMRSFDIIASSLALLLFLPLLLITALIIRISSPGPVLFVQQRMGKGGIPFPCLKFRSMVIDAKERLEELLVSSEQVRQEWQLDQKLRNDPRITPIGQFLRKTSLDELPQLFNVLWGHMSIVGPRPIIENEIVRYGVRYTAYCNVRPGLTGLWQVSGRNDVSYGTRVRLDAFYVQRKSLTYDLSICFRTIPAILAARGSY